MNREIKKHGAIKITFLGSHSLWL